MAVHNFVPAKNSSLKVVFKRTQGVSAQLSLTYVTCMQSCLDSLL